MLPVLQYLNVGIGQQAVQKLLWTCSAQHDPLLLISLAVFNFHSLGVSHTSQDLCEQLKSIC